MDLFTLVLIFFVPVEAEMLTTSKFTRTPAQNVKFNHSDVHFSPVPKLECASFCAARSGCLSYSYQAVSGTCHVYDRVVTFGAQTAPASGFQHFWRLADECPTASGYALVSGMCVRVVDTRRTFADAEEDCRAGGGHLYVGDSPEKMSILKTAISFYGNPGLDYRVGASFQNSTWFWITGADVEATAWENNQPGSGVTLQCCETVLNEPNLLTADGCSKIDRYVCQITLRS